MTLAGALWLQLTHLHSASLTLHRMSTLLLSKPMDKMRVWKAKGEDWEAHFRSQTTPLNTFNISFFHACAFICLFQTPHFVATPYCFICNLFLFCFLSILDVQISAEGLFFVWPNVTYGSWLCMATHSNRRESQIQIYPHAYTPERQQGQVRQN